jgi:hypothetical protein
MTNQSNSSVHSKADPYAATPVPRGALLWLTAGFGVTLLFPIIYTIEGVIWPGYSPLRETISSLAFGPTGRIQQLNFALCGVGILVMAVAWHQILAGGVCATWYPSMRVAEGVGLIAIGIFSLDPLHTAFMILIVQAMTLGLFVIARRFWKRPAWRGWAAYSIACGLWPMVVMPFFGVALSGHGPLSGYAGLFERLATNADTVWSLVLVARLWTRRSVGI